MIGGRFYDILGEELVEKVVDAIQGDGIYDWAPHMDRVSEANGHPGDEDDPDDPNPRPDEPEEHPDQPAEPDPGEYQSRQHILPLEIIRERRSTDFQARSTLWNEIRSRGEPQLVVRAVTIPRIRITDRPPNPDALAVALGWQDANIEYDAFRAGTVADAAVSGWMIGATEGLEFAAPPNEFFDRVRTARWISIHRNPIEPSNLTELFLNAQSFIQVAPQLAIAVLIVGGAFVLLNVGWHAAEPIGDALGQRFRRWLLDRGESEAAVGRIEAFAEREGEDD